MTTIGLIGGGPAALFMYKALTADGMPAMDITIFEKNKQLGAGMPYSNEGANVEHITNVSGNEIPELHTEVLAWVTAAPAAVLSPFKITAKSFNEYKVMPRLLFGKYLEDQFSFIEKRANANGHLTKKFFETTVIDITDDSVEQAVTVIISDKTEHVFDTVVICTGHQWPKDAELYTQGWYDSPYPPKKLAQKTNFAVAIKGAALTAIDAVRTLSRSNGKFVSDENCKVTYQLDDDCPNFKLVMHSIGGMLPAVRFHLDDPQLVHGKLITEEEAYAIKAANDGFIPLDFIFERNFLQPLQIQNPALYEEVKGMQMEAFVTHMMALRNTLDAFTLLAAECKEAEKSIKGKKAVFWKETLAALSYAVNYPAKHFCAEDMLRLKTTLMPLIAIVIAFVPQSSCRELMALHDAGVLSLLSVNKDSKAVPHRDGGAIYSYEDDDGNIHEVLYQMYVDAVGQPHYMYKDFPFDGLKAGGTVSAAFLNFKSADAAVQAMENGNMFINHDSEGNYYLELPGININDHFQVLDKFGAYNPRIYMMAVPHIGGLNPDYSGLDFCEMAASRIRNAMS